MLTEHTMVELVRTIERDSAVRRWWEFWRPSHPMFAAANGLILLQANELRVEAVAGNDLIFTWLLDGKPVATRKFTSILIGDTIHLRDVRTQIEVTIS